METSVKPMLACSDLEQLPTLMVLGRYGKTVKRHTMGSVEGIVSGSENRVNGWYR
jgi:hypothetical protein